MNIAQLLTTVQPLLTRYPYVTPTDALALLSHAKLQHYRKGETVQRDGTNKKVACLVLDGIFRTYMTSIDGHESTLSLHRPMEFFGTWESIYLSKTTTRALGAASNGTLLVYDYAVLKQLLFSNPRLQEAYYELTEHMHVSMLMFYQNMISLRSPEQRYAFIDEWLGDYHSTISQRIVSSFVGINPVSLSRIKKRLE